MDREKAKRNLEVILDKINTDTDIIQLREYQKIYKKEISLFKRSWAAAWLLMYYDKRETPGAAPSLSSKPQNSKIKKSRPEQPEGNLRSPRPVEVPAKSFPEKPVLDINLSEEESKRLFFSIGKNRRLFPREVITLIMTKTSTPREDIGMIRILDNYSFVQVRDNKADEIIEKLTGHKFRGRTLTVNYAKPKVSDNDESN